MKKLLGSFIAVALLFAGSVRADQGTQRLVYEAQRLDDLVRYSDLHYEVQRQVSQFRWDAESLADCDRFSHGPHGGQDCNRELRQTQQSFNQAARYLSSTAGRYPQIYQQFRRTDQALRSITFVSGPAGFRCIATDNGFEEHWGGHIGEGRTQFEARRNALMECEARHGRCSIQRCDPVRF